MSKGYNHKMLCFLTSLSLTCAVLSPLFVDNTSAAIRPVETRAAPYIELRPKSFFSAQDIRNFYPALEKRTFEVSRPSQVPAGAKGDLSEIKDRGKLRILSAYRHKVTRPGQEDRIDYALAREFAEEQGLEPELLEVSDPARLLSQLVEGQGDVIIGETPLFNPDDPQVSGTLPLNSRSYQVITRHDDVVLRDPSDLYGKRIALRASSPLWPILEAYQSRYPEIEIIAVPDYWQINDFLNRIGEKEYDATVIETGRYTEALARRPDISVAFDLVKEQSRAWLVRSEDNELRNKLDDFLNRKHLARRSVPLYHEDLSTLKKNRLLRVITRPDPNNYFIKQGKPAGFAYELVAKFARQHGMRLQIVQAADEQEMLAFLEQGRGDMITSPLSERPDPEQIIQSSPYATDEEHFAADALQSWSMMVDSDELQAAVNEFFRAEYRGEFYNVTYRKYFSQHKEQRHAELLKKERLSPYDSLAKEYASRYNFDWRLIVAQMYAESRFDPGVVSHVGAEGLMQVLPETAREMGFNEVITPEAGIHAGVQYMDWLRKRFEQDLALEDRTWFSLAAYNAGLARVQKARKKAADMGLDPNRWFGNVELAMAGLSVCRCGQTVAYVNEIRNLYDAYVQMIDSIRLASIRQQRVNYYSS